MHENFLLTIAIPTYNRSKILNKTLKSITTDSAFCDIIEIVISDNCSTDDTYEVVAEYTKKYSNVKYYRNEQNVNDLNFALALSYGKGKYLKLLNDTARFKQGKLQSIVSLIEKNQENENNLMFYDNNVFYKNTIKQCSNLNDFVKNSSFFVTWIGNFGTWRKAFLELENKDQCSYLKLPQVDWSFRLANKYETILIYDDFYEVEYIREKGGYNLFQIFINNYLLLFQPYIKNRKISCLRLEGEKYKLYRHFIFPRIFSKLFPKESTYSYDLHNWKIFFKSYIHYPYVILSFLFIPLIYMLKKYAKLNNQH